MMGFSQKLEETRIDFDPRLAKTFMSDFWSLELWEISVPVRNKNYSNLIGIPVN